MGLAAAFLNAGNRCLHAGMYPEAVLYYSRCHTIAPLFSEPMFNAGLARLRAGEVEQGLSALRLALDSRPELLERLGPGSVDDVLDGLGRAPQRAYELAPLRPEDLDEEFEAEPRVTYSSQAHLHMAAQDAHDAYRRGVACLNAQDFAGAVAELEEAIRLDPVVPHPHNDLGVAHLLLGEHANAVEPIRKALRLAPGYGAAHLNLAGALQGVGEYAEAISHLEQALEHDSDLEQAVVPQLEACRARLAGAPSDTASWGEHLADRKGDAEFHRLALLTRFLELEQVCQWIDHELGVPPNQAPLCEQLATSESEDAVWEAARQLLEDLPGTFESGRPERALLGLFGKRLAADSGQRDATIYALSRLNEDDRIPEDGDFVMMRARYGNDVPADELVAFLGRFTDDADRFIESGSI